PSRASTRYGPITAGSARRSGSAPSRSRSASVSSPVQGPAGSGSDIAASTRSRAARVRDVGEDLLHLLLELLQRGLHPVQVSLGLRPHLTPELLRERPVPVAGVAELLAVAVQLLDETG